MRLSRHFTPLLVISANALGGGIVESELNFKRDRRWRRRHQRIKCRGFCREWQSSTSSMLSAPRIRSVANPARATMRIVEFLNSMALTEIQRCLQNKCDPWVVIFLIVTKEKTDCFTQNRVVFAHVSKLLFACVSKLLMCSVHTNILLWRVSFDTWQLHFFFDL